MLTDDKLLWATLESLQGKYLVKTVYYFPSNIWFNPILHKANQTDSLSKRWFQTHRGAPTTSASSN